MKAIVKDSPSGERRPKWEYLSLLTLTVAVSLVFAGLVAVLLRLAWTSGFTASSAAVILLLVGCGAGPMFTAFRISHPTAEARTRTLQNLVQGAAYVGSGVAYAAVSFSEDWWLVFAAVAVVWLGIIRLSMATGREPTAQRHHAGP